MGIGPHPSAGLVARLVLSLGVAMTRSVHSMILLIALVAALAMAPVAPEAGNVLFLVAGGFALLLFRKRAAELLPRPIVWMPLAGLILMAVSYVIGAGSLEALIGVFYFAPLVAVWPLLALAGRDRPTEPALIGMLALCGAAGAAVVAIGEVASTGTFRAGTSVANPIHFADVALTAGFLTTIGFVYGKGAWRYSYLLGPVLAGTAVMLSGTRGAVVAFAAMILAAGLCATLLRLVSPRALLLTVAALGVALMIALIAGLAETSGLQRVMADLTDVLGGSLPDDRSTALRLQMYMGGVRAFLQSPLVGHGPFEFAALAGLLADVPFEGAPHLHNDPIDFAASAGGLGVVAYFLFLLAPLAEVLSARQSRTRDRLVVVVSTLTVGYFVMGMTNAMFGILTVTVLFAAICVIIGLLAHSDVDAQSSVSQMS